MAVFNASILMRELRKASGLTQKRVAEGVCSRSTLCAIERGDFKPDWFIFRNVMMKLNVDPTRYYNDIVSEDETYVYNQQAINSKLLTAIDIEGLKSQISKMEQDKRFAKGNGYLLLLASKSAMHHYEPCLDPDLAFKYAMEYLKILRSDFEIDKIPTYFLSPSELLTVNKIGNTYAFSGNHEKALEIFYMTLDNIEKNYMIDVCYQFEAAYFTLLSNAALTLMRYVGRYDESIQLADKGMDMMKDFYASVHYIHLLYSKASSLIYLGRKQEGEHEFRRCIMYAYAMNNDVSAEMTIESLKNDFEKQFNYKLDLTMQL